MLLLRRLTRELSPRRLLSRRFAAAAGGNLDDSDDFVDISSVASSSPSRRPPRPSTQDWGLGNDGSRSNIFGSNLHTSSTSVTLAHAASEEGWRELALRALDRSSSSSGDSNDGGNHHEDTAIWRKRLRWAASKRGWVEAGRFLEGFAGAHLPTMTRDDLAAFERLLAADDMFLMKLVANTSATDVPPELDTPILASMQDYAKAGEFRLLRRGAGAGPS